MMDCDIVLTVYNKILLTENCLESIVRHFRRQDNLIIIDNGSEKDTQEYLESFKKKHPELPVEIVTLSPNRGFLAAANRGMKQSTKNSVCLLSNDTIVTAGWLDRMCGLIERQKTIGIVNPMSTTFGLYPGPKESPDDIAHGLAAKGGQYVESASCVGFCMLIKKEVIRAAGYLDEAFSDGYFEDTDYCRRAIKAGFICAIAKDAYVWHKEHATFNDSSREALFRKNREIFERRWGKPRRIMYIAACSKEQRAAVIAECLTKARQGNWIWLIVPRRFLAEFSAVTIHGNIRLIGLPGIALWLYPFFLYLVKRKKPINEIKIIARR